MKSLGIHGILTFYHNQNYLCQDFGGLSEFGLDFDSIQYIVYFVSFIVEINFTYFHLICVVGHADH